jgi:asparagine synthase (glutamine-hydrolysing)
MCGIAGWVDFERDLRGEHARLEAMTESLAHRGPDDAGTWLARHAALGHRRLAILDLERGRQPMIHEADGQDRIVLVYTGEVYNYRELRSELIARGHRFRTECDTEVVLRGWVEWGKRLPERLNGMFAFVVWDAAQEELVLVRDRLGIKPLFYVRLPNGIAFASEPKALLAGKLLEPVVDAQGICELFSMVRTPGEGVFESLREVLPGGLVSVRASGFVETRYWRLEHRDHVDDLPTTIRTVRELLEDAVERQLVADVPLCALLSGGLDSSAVTAIAQRVRRSQAGDPVRSFSVGFSAKEPFRPDALRSSLDAPFVAEFVDRIGTEHADVLIEAEEAMLPTARLAPLLARDLPPLGEQDISLFLLSRAVRAHSTVALSGEGADELFGGYRWFHDAETVRADAFPWVASARRLGRYSLLEPRLAGFDVAGYQLRRYREALADVPHGDERDPVERRMREICFFHLSRFLPNALERKDRMSMAVGLEVRVPFCDHRLVEYVFNAPWATKTFDGREKALLRAAAADLLPASILERPKNPYPALQDLAYHAFLRAAVGELVSRKEARVFALAPRPLVRALAALPASGNPAIQMGLERILGIQDWLERYRVQLEL